MKYLLLFTIVISPFFSFGQTQCVELPSGQWTGETSLTNGGTTSGTVSVSKTGSSLHLSDLSGGLLAHFNLPDQPIDLTINCDGSIQAELVNNNTVGAIHVTSGSYNASSQKLTLNWEIPSNKISQTTTLTY